MVCLRPATPGFIVTLIATILLAVVSFCVPYFKTIYFLKATINVDNYQGSITFGTLGYCLELSNGTTCSKPSIGYELDINGLVGNKLPIEIPQVAVKWITYALFLHVIALIGAAGSAFFGLLAHVREMSMTCCSTCISGFAAVVAMFAFIFDLVLFFVAKARINNVGTAQIGNAIWLTLIAWILLFFSGCFYTIGRCCISQRPSAPSNSKWNRKNDPENGPHNDNYAEQMRLDAVKAEADRKARQKQTEGGLPAFYETQPLTGRVDGDHVYLDDQDNESQTNLANSAAAPGRRPSGTGYAAGYVQGTPGTRTIDDYYSPQPPTPTTYPPQRQPSNYTASTPQSPATQHSLPSQNPGYGYAASSPYSHNPSLTSSPQPVNTLLAAPTHGQDQYGRDYGHGAAGSSYHTPSPQHGQQTSGYSQYNPYVGAPQRQDSHSFEPSYNPHAYTPPMPNANDYAANPYIGASSPPPQNRQPERSYTLGGDGYGANPVSPLQDYSSATPAAYYGYGDQNAPPHTQSPAPINTDVGYAAEPTHTSPVRGPRPPPGAVHEDAPPGYDAGTSGITGNWGKQ